MDINPLFSSDARRLAFRRALSATKTIAFIREHEDEKICYIRPANMSAFGHKTIEYGLQSCPVTNKVLRLLDGDKCAYIEFHYDKEKDAAQTDAS